VRIIRVDTTRFGRGRLAGRASDYASYLAGALFRLLRMPPPDVIVAMSDPPLLLGVALAAARLRGGRVVYWLQDLYPHLAARLGVLREDSPAYRALYESTFRLHAACDAVITLGPRMTQAVVASGARPERTGHVHNWADTESLYPVPPADNPFLRQHDLVGKFVVLYSGNAGRAHVFDAVIEAMRRLRDDPDVVFLFIGGGKSLPEIRARCEREGLKNVRFLDYVAREEIRYSLSSASASLVTEAPGVVGLLVPSKTYGILASGRPLLFVGSSASDVAEVVRDSGAGFIISPDDPASLVDRILHLKANPAVAQEAGRRARHAAESRYSRTSATRQWDEMVRELLGMPARDATPNA
jgi:glycosyltransferase involved in cell wall biosynthesis